MNKKHILVVDDSPVLLKKLSSILAGPQGGYEVTTAEGGDVALLLCENNSYDLVVTDVNMPNFDGFELVRRLRKQEEYSKTPIIIATTRSAEEDRLLAQELGVEVWMVKPVQEGALLKTIDHLLKD